LSSTPVGLCFNWFGGLVGSMSRQLFWLGHQYTQTQFESDHQQYALFDSTVGTASHILALICRRLSADWIDLHGHCLYLIETFVAKNRFRDTCYKAANWIHLGQTKGRSRNDRYAQL
jgi:hypothetical protein